jgi:serine/threonine-protein kinase
MFPTEQPPAALKGFELLQRLGRGGAGEVFLARSRGGKLVAIKTIAGASAGGSLRLVDTFAREASVCARLHHPCIVQVRAFFEEPGFAALVFEYVPGVALGRLMRLLQGRGARIPDRAAWYVMERVLSALDYAHTFRDEGGEMMPIIHRDVSPANVLVDWSGGVKIADFGIAKILGASPATRVGLVTGTPGCMSPEQARGEPVDARADVYAAALLAWRLATGRGPFGKQQNDDFELMRAMRNPQIKPLASLRPDLPESLLDAIARALEPDRERRTITAAELSQAVREGFDLAEGRSELAALLERSKEGLESAVKRSPGDATDVGRAALTLRYEEAALALDEDAALDGPTFEAHALPADGAQPEPAASPARGEVSAAQGPPAVSSDEAVPAATPAAAVAPAAAPPAAATTPASAAEASAEPASPPAASESAASTAVARGGGRARIAAAVVALIVAAVAIGAAVGLLR